MTSFILNDTEINVLQLINDELDIDQFSEFESTALQIIKNYYLGQREFSIKTSGSTGKPKTLVFSREQVILSAKRTLKTFNLKPGDKILACLNPQFIAGMMMLLRAIEGDLSLTIQSPDTNTLKSFTSKQFMDFVSFTPNQVEQILRATPEKLALFKKILIGGAGLHSALEEKLTLINSEIFQSYAMTETLTHTAIRKINSHEKSIVYRALEGVRYEVDERSCLVIQDDILGIEGLATNDVVELVSDSSFIWRGRYDNVINSGGIKIQLEETELKIKAIFREMNIENTFCLIAQADQALTQKLIMLIEHSPFRPDVHTIQQKLKEKLPLYQAPKELIIVPEIILTESGKIDRQNNFEKYAN